MIYQLWESATILFDNILFCEMPWLECKLDNSTLILLGALRREAVIYVIIE